MTKAKKPPHDDSQIEEIDLSLIDLSAIDINDLTSLAPKKPLPFKKEKEEKSKEFSQKIEKSNDDDDDFEDPIITRDFDDDFDDDDDLKKDSYKTPKDFFTDKRRQKTLKKFIDVTVPQEFLDGLSDDLQLLIKK